MQIWALKSRVNKCVGISAGSNKHILKQDSFYNGNLTRKLSTKSSL